MPPTCGKRVPVLVRWLLGLGVAGTLAANVAHGLGHGPVGAAAAAWPAVALVVGAAHDDHPQRSGIGRSNHLPRSGSTDTQNCRPVRNGSGSNGKPRTIRVED